MKLLFIAIYFINLSYAGPIVVSAEKVSREYNSTTQNVQFFNSVDINESSSTSLSEFLSVNTNLLIRTRGSRAGLTSISQRGNSSRSTLLIIDGIVIKDTTTPNGNIDWSKISLNNIESIEILKGPQGVSYGAGTGGGVIKITTKNNNLIDITSSYGSYNTFSNSINFSKNLTSKMKISVFSDISSSEGISSFVNGEEKDKYKVFIHGLKLNYKIKKRILNFNFTNKNFELDYDLFNKDDSDLRTSQNSNSGNFFYKEKLTDKISNTFIFSKTSSRRKETYGIFKGKDTRVENALTYSYRKNTFIKLGAEFLNDEANFNEIYKKNSTTAVYLYHGSEKNGRISDGGFRYIVSDEFENVLTYGYGFGYQFNKINSIFKFNHSASINTPSIYEYLNKQDMLTFEKTNSFQVSWKQNLKNTNYELTWLYTNIINQIVYDSVTKKYKNLKATQSTGFEFVSETFINNNVILKFNTSLLKTSNTSLKKDIIYSPRSKASLNFSYLYSDKLSFISSLNFIGKRYTSEDNKLSLPSYSLVGIGANFRVNKNNLFKIQINNLLNKSYEETLGYGTMGRNFIVSLNNKF